MQQASSRDAEITRSKFKNSAWDSPTFPSPCQQRRASTACSEAPGYLARPPADSSQRLIQLAMGRRAEISVDAFQAVPGRQRWLSITLAFRAASAQSVTPEASSGLAGSFPLFAESVVRFLGEILLYVVLLFLVRNGKRSVAKIDT